MKKVNIKNAALALALGFGVTTMCGNVEAGLKSFLSNAKTKIKNNKTVQLIAKTAKDEMAKSLTQQTNATLINDQGNAHEWSYTGQLILGQISSRLNSLTSAATTALTSNSSDTTNTLTSKDKGYLDDIKSKVAEAIKSYEDLSNGVNRYGGNATSETSLSDMKMAAATLGLSSLMMTLSSRVQMIVSLAQILSPEVQINFTALISELQELMQKLQKVIDYLSCIKTPTREDLTAL